MTSSRAPGTRRDARRHTRALHGLMVFGSALMVLGASVLVGVPDGAGAPGSARSVPAVTVGSVTTISAGPATATSRSGAAALPSFSTRAALPPAAAQQPRVPYLAVVAVYTAERTAATESLGLATAGLDAARVTLAESAGRVLADDRRTELADGIRALDAEVAQVRLAVDRATRHVDTDRPSGSYFSTTAGFASATASLRDSNADDLARQTDVLTAAAQAVTDAVAAWQAEQDRLAAEEAARLTAIEKARVAADAAAAAADAAGARATSGNGSSGNSGNSTGTGTGSSGAIPPTSTAMFDKRVWTSGFQAEIDACNGAVDVTGNYGVAVIAEHWSCGGARFPGSGSVITLSGVRSGTYRVDGVAAVLNANTHGTSDVPRGYDLLYQTCINGSNATMSFTVLTRIG